MNKIAVIDFDGTITSSSYPDTKEPQRGIKEALTKMQRMGYDIHILSCRTSPDLFPHPIDRQEQVRLMKQYMDKYELPYDQILNKDKPIAHIYIDDRGVGFRGDWDKVVEEMESM